MVPDRVIYTDGHDVTVTDSMLQVNKAKYKLDGIIKHGLFILRPQRLPGILMVTIGLITMFAGLLKLIPTTWINDTIIGDTLVSGSTIAMILGASIAFIGVLLLGMIRQRYSVRISTAEGEKDVVVSSRKEYIQQIVDALNSAYNYIRNNV
jgi:hypothetical protein